MRKYYKKVPPKCKQITLNQIYGVPTDKETNSKCQEIRGDDKAFIEKLQEIGRVQKRGKSSIDRGKGIR
jgi:phage FluMu protein Com